MVNPNVERLVKECEQLIVQIKEKHGYMSGHQCELCVVLRKVRNTVRTIRKDMRRWK